MDSTTSGSQKSTDSLWFMCSGRLRAKAKIGEIQLKCNAYLLLPGLVRWQLRGGTETHRKVREHSMLRATSASAFRFSQKKNSGMGRLSLGDNAWIMLTNISIAKCLHLRKGSLCLVRAEKKAPQSITSTARKKKQSVLNN